MSASPVPNVEPNPHEEAPPPPIAVIQLTRTSIGSGSQVFLNPDEAWTANRDSQRYMRRDLDIAYPLEQRIRAVRRCEWSIIPEDEKDPAQQAEARAIERCIRNLRNRAGFVRALLLACWYGHAAAFVQYATLGADRAITGTADDDGSESVATFAPVAWTPVHPDSVEFRFSGEPVVKVNTYMLDEKQRSMLIVGTSAPVLRLTPEQRACFVVNTYNVEAGDYDIARDAALAFSGRGLRSDVWHTWYQKQRHLQSAAMYAERHARGTVVMRYPSGNDKAREEAIQAGQNFLADSVVAFPSEAAEADDRFRYEIHEPAGNGWQIHFRMITEYYQPLFLKMIVGQTLGSGTDKSGTGMGSGVSDQHERTFLEIVEDDAEGLDDCLTEQLVRVIQQMNWPESKWRHRYKTAIKKQDVEKMMAAIESFKNMGGKVAESTVRDVLGIPEPDDDDEILGEGDGFDDHAGHDMLDAVERRNGELNGVLQRG